MKKLLIILLCGFGLQLHAQPKKYQGLLWEISGNGLQQKSYVYGSMHVSEKVSYHLSDAFFKHLLAADIVATESDPATWMELYSVLGQNPNLETSYASFYRNPVKREELASLFESSNYLMNNLLFRTSESRQDYQEETYLDLFIYQTGKKHNKTVVGLENARKSMIDVLNAEPMDFNPDPEKMQAIMKLLRDRSYQQAMIDFYREKNLDMLDSLYVLATPPKFMKALIYDRNLIMAHSIDSLSKKGSLFAAIGAAHLPGNKGVIELLRAKGYSVKAVSSDYTETGRKLKSGIENLFRKPEFQWHQSLDSVIRIPLVGKPVAFGQYHLSPDLSNGSMASIKRVALRQFLQKKNQPFDPSRLDSLFYEHVPGEILSKQINRQGNITTYDILSRLKNGQSSRYRLYQTPLEIICINMNGKGEYIREFEAETFSKAELQPTSANWSRLELRDCQWSILSPANRLLYPGETTAGSLEMNAFDPQANAWYFALVNILDDASIVEDSQYELSRIVYEFLREIGGKTTDQPIIASATAFRTKALLGDRNLELMCRVKGQQYVLLATIDAPQTDSNRFFDSFRPSQAATETEKTVIYTDSASHFSIEIPEKRNESLTWKLKQNEEFSDPEIPTLFEENNKSYNITNREGKRITVEYQKYHRYDAAVNRDSIWNGIQDLITQKHSGWTIYPPVSTGHHQYITDKDAMAREWQSRMGLDDKTFRDQHPFTIKNLPAVSPPGAPYTEWNAVSSCEGCPQSVRHKIVTNGSETWWMNALVEKDKELEDPFVERTLASFRPLSESEPDALLREKFKLFLEDVNSGVDSLRTAALAESYRLKIDADELPDLQQFLSEFEPTPGEIHGVISLIQKAAELKTERVYDMFQKLYTARGTTSDIQISILNALAQTQDARAYQTIASLMETDLPLSDDGYSLEQLFSRFSKNPKYSRELYPKIFAHFGIPEYQAPVLNFTASLFREKEVPTSKIRRYRKLLLSNARLEFKRVSGANPDVERSVNDSLSGDGFQSVEKLIRYVQILYPYRNDKSIGKFLISCRNLRHPGISLELLALAINYNQPITPADINELIQNPATRYDAYVILKKADQLPQQLEMTEKDLALAVLLKTSANAKLQAEFLDKRSIENAGKKTDIYFFRYQIKQPAEEVMFMDNSKMLAAVSFAPGEEGSEAGIYRLSMLPYPLDADELPERYDSVADEFLNSNHQRSSFGANSSVMMTEFLD